MRQVRWASVMVGMAMLAVCGVRPAVADIRSDQAAAILEWPNILFFEADALPGSLNVIDTIVQISNTSTEPVVAWCFYENANAHCTNTGAVCLTQFPETCCDMTLGCGLCQPGWNETDFRVRLTPEQPLGWLASQGLAGFDTTPPKSFGTFPISGVFGSCSPFDHNQPPCTISNAGSAVPPVPESPFNGSLRCIAVNDDNTPVDRNVLKGEQTLGVLANDFDLIQVAKDNAIGIQAIPGAVNDDNILVLGGDGAEYNGCPSVLILNHFFDFADNPALNDDNYEDAPAPVLTVLTLVPCSQDFLRQIPGAATVQFLVFNEFEQRFSASTPFNCKFITLLSNIDTTQNERSIFSAGVAGTLTGQTRIRSVEPFSGILGDATEIHDVTAIADFNLHYQGDRATSDFIILP
jgi:hypothetical protein